MELAWVPWGKVSERGYKEGLAEIRGSVLAIAVVPVPGVNLSRAAVPLGGSRGTRRRQRQVLALFMHGRDAHTSEGKKSSS